MQHACIGRDHMATKQEDGVNHHHTVKCVIVGDGGVGKSLLVSARATSKKYELKDLFKTHISSVWAVDHYRTNLEVEKRSWYSVDGFRCALRIWDTMGSHDKDRQFAYNGADVVVICFSICDRKSLQHVETFWCDEVKMICKDVPIVICACQIDRRYIHQDPEYVKLESKNAFSRKVMPKDLIRPKEGRAVAAKVGASYYETSVLAQYGIDDLFDNCIRAAVAFRRGTKFWIKRGGPKKVLMPRLRLQVPHLPPRPLPPQVCLGCSKPDTSKFELITLDYELFSDVVFVVGGEKIPAYGCFLVAVSKMFEKLFCGGTNRDAGSFYSHLLRCSKCMDKLKNPHSSWGIELYNKCNSNIVKKQNFEITSKGRHESTTFNDAPASLVSNLKFNENTSETNSNIEDYQRDCIPDAFTGIEKTDGCEKFVVTIDEKISPSDFRTVLMFLYRLNLLDDVQELVNLKASHAASMMGIFDLEVPPFNKFKESKESNTILSQDTFIKERSKRIVKLFIERNLLSDVVFELDDGTVQAHRCFFAARSEVMKTMLTSDFHERSQKKVKFPGVSKDVFSAFQYFIYTGQYPENCKDWFGLIDIAKCYCLEELFDYAQVAIARELGAAIDSGQNVIEETLLCLKQAELFGAKKLADWCKWYITGNYQEVLKDHGETLDALSEELQLELLNSMWPPEWYLEETKIYENTILEMNNMQSIKKPSYYGCMRTTCAGRIDSNT